MWPCLPAVTPDCLRSPRQALHLHALPWGCSPSILPLPGMLSPPPSTLWPLEAYQHPSSPFFLFIALGKWRDFLKQPSGAYSSEENWHRGVEYLGAACSEWEGLLKCTYSPFSCSFMPLCSLLLYCENPSIKLLAPHPTLLHQIFFIINL